MRPRALGIPKKLEPRVLLLRTPGHPPGASPGSAALADRILRDLERLGLQVQAIDCLAHPAHPGGMDELKSLLKSKVQSLEPAQFLLHPGVTPWAIRPEIHAVAQDLNLVVIGPSPKVMSLFSNQIQFLGHAESLGIQHLAVSLEPIQSAREVESLLKKSEMFRDRNKYPVVLKSVQLTVEDVGIRVFTGAAELQRDLPLWLDQLRRNAGEALIIAERYLEGARQILVPFARTHSGTVHLFPATDISLRSHNRALLDFCPAQNVDDEAIKLVHQWTELLLSSCQYVGVGGLEFLVDGPRAYLIKGYSGLPSNFPVWEKVEGRSAVASQLDTFFGAATLGEPVATPRAFAAGIRIYAEDPVLRIPQPGKIVEFDSGLGQVKNTFAEAELDLSSESREVSADSDAWLGTLWVAAKGRKQCLELASKVLNEVWIAGTLQTNIRMLSELFEHPWIKEGIFHAGFVEEDFVPQLYPGLHEVQAFLGACRFLQGEFPAREGQPWIWNLDVDKAPQAVLDWVEGPRVSAQFGVGKIYSGRIRIHRSTALGLQAVRICMTPLASTPELECWRVQMGQWSRVIRRTPAASRGKRIPFFAQAAGRVHALLFGPGKRIGTGDPAIIIESARILVPHPLPIDVKITEWKVKAEDRVQYGTLLAWLEGVDAKL